MYQDGSVQTMEFVATRRFSRNAHSVYISSCHELRNFLFLSFFWLFAVFHVFRYKTLRILSKVLQKLLFEKSLSWNCQREFPEEYIGRSKNLMFIKRYKRMCSNLTYYYGKLCVKFMISFRKTVQGSCPQSGSIIE